MDVILLHDGPQDLIDEPARRTCGSTQHALFPRTELAKTCDSLAGIHQRARFDPMRTHDFEEEISNEPGRFGRGLSAPPIGRERKSPFGGLKTRFQRANVYQSDRARSDACDKPDFTTTLSAVEKPTEHRTQLLPATRRWGEELSDFCRPDELPEGLIHLGLHLAHCHKIALQFGYCLSPGGGPPTLEGHLFHYVWYRQVQQKGYPASWRAVGQ